MKIKLAHQDKNIGKVLFIVEGDKDEGLILGQIFMKIFNYQFERLTRD